MKKNPFSGYKILSYEVFIKTDLGWANMKSSKTRKGAELYLKHCGLRGVFRFSRMRQMEDQDRREDLYEIARS